MLPGFSVPNLQYPSARDTKLPTKLAEVFVAGADSSHVIISEDAFVMACTHLLTFLDNHISNVVSVRTNKEMLWIYTVWMIARVSNDTLWIYLSVLYLKC